MELIGMLDSPYVRRVAVTAQFLDIAYDHNPLSIFKGYDEFRQRSLATTAKCWSIRH